MTLSLNPCRAVSPARHHVRPGPTRTPCLSRWISGRCPYESNRATACRAEVAASRSGKAEVSMPNEPHFGQEYLYPRSAEERIRSAAVPHRGQFAGSGSMVADTIILYGYTV